MKAARNKEPAVTSAAMGELLQDGRWRKTLMAGRGGKVCAVKRSTALFLLFF
jgi:hypothetical protein